MYEIMVLKLKRILICAELVLLNYIFKVLRHKP